LETKNPQAIVAATSRDTETAGAVYPFPLIEDGDFDIPSVYMTEEEGHRLSEHVGQETRLEIRAERTPAKGYNVIARKGPRSCRVVLFAHIDAKDRSPGATDNATGVTALLLLAEMLQNYSDKLGVEIVALNGEDYYSNPGERQYLEFNAGRFSEIVLGINMDGVGYRRGDTAYSLYECPSPLDGLIHTTFSAREGLIQGPSWYQGDHYLFLMNERPALALTSERVDELLSEFVHTPQDSPEIADPAKIVDVAIALRDLLLQLSEQA
jgi:aminopeptidase YwaD